MAIGKAGKAWRRTVLVAGLGAMFALSGCGGNGRGIGGGRPAARPAEDAAVDRSTFDVVVGAVVGANVQICEPAEGGQFVALPRPTAAAAQEVSYFRYLEGRIYEFGPCQLAPGARNELRVFRYGEVETRDAAVLDVSKRKNRPTSIFTMRDLYAVEIWSPEPALDSPVGQLAAQAHVALSRVPEARHPEGIG